MFHGSLSSQTHFCLLEEDPPSLYSAQSAKGKIKTKSDKWGRTCSTYRRTESFILSFCRKV